MMKHYEQILIAIDQLFNALLGGWADETLSSRSWRQHTKKTRWKIARRVIDTIFFWQPNHCYQAYESERLRIHEPPSLRKR